MAISHQDLKRLITKSHLVERSELQKAEVTASHLGVPLIDVLLGRDLLRDNDLGKILSQHYHTKFVDLTKLRIPQHVLNVIDESIATSRSVVVFARDDHAISLAMPDPKDLELIEYIRKTIGGGIKITSFVATPHGIKEALKLYQKKQQKEELGDVQRDVVPTSIIAIIEELIEDAIRSNASDIHIEPLPDATLIRFRIDGVLHDKASHAKSQLAPLVARVKVLSALKLDEQRHPQDGQFAYIAKNGEKYSFRVSTVPTVYGEKIVLRILEDTITKFNLEDLGLLPEDETVLSATLDRTHGMMLVTGPTGSGKTTTLYTILGLLNKPGVNIITIEDPVENKIRRVNQIQVNAQIDLTFAKGLRSILRQDPDIIMVGEIRDTETAIISVNAAMTGHLVVSSIHANNAAGAIPRMIDLGVEPFLVASTVNLVIAQRLVRVLCPKCKQESPLTPQLKERLQQASGKISPLIRKKITTNYIGRGCTWCHHTGFRGRIGIFELIPVTDTLRSLIVNKATTAAIWDEARKNGAKSMIEDGFIKVHRGLTTIEEVFRVISE